MHDLSALDQAAAIRAGDLSPVDLVSHYLERIERLDPALGAFVTVTADRALDQARAAADQIGSGAGELPPLLGVPTTIKDLTSTAGVPTAFGSRAYAEHVPDTDAHTVT